GSYSRGIAVAPLRRVSEPQGAPARSPLWSLIKARGASASTYWTVMTETPGGEAYRLDEDNTAYLAAPAENIWSVDAVITDLSKQEIGFGLAPRSGSSMAAPIVAALAARVKHDSPEMRWGELKRWLLATSTPLYVPSVQELESAYAGNLNEKIIGIVNFYRAIKMNFRTVGAWGDPTACDGQPQRATLGEHSTCLGSGVRILLHRSLYGDFSGLRSGDTNTGWMLPLALRRNPHTRAWSVLWSVGASCMDLENSPPRCETFKTTRLCLEADEARGCLTKPDCVVDPTLRTPPEDACVAIELPNRGGERGVDLSKATHIVGISPDTWIIRP
ncbi:MAG: S8 family serine peptidase, partial [Parvularculaceae bacterium]|nr:S8 family serine peptidase [Parvularculaceae bacterium]